jgi:hypothetical protein
MFSEELLRSCWSQNPDGAGYMYPHNDRVHIIKGMMTLPDLLASLQANEDTLEDKPVVIHFRKATAGRKDAGNCHPFPMCDNYQTMRRTETDCDVGVAHNGIIDIDPRKGEGEYSDTMHFIRHCLSLHPEVISRPDTMLNMAIGFNKFCFMTPTKIHYLGSWHQQDGYKYSNYGYRHKPDPLPSTSFDLLRDRYGVNCLERKEIASRQAGWDKCRRCIYRKQYLDAAPCKICKKTYSQFCFKEAASDKDFLSVHEIDELFKNHQGVLL